MSEFEDPCRELEIEEGSSTPGASSGDGSSPSPSSDPPGPARDYDLSSTLPQFPSAQNDIPEPPNYRYSIIVPRQFYYAPYIFTWLPRSPIFAVNDASQALQGSQASDLRLLSDDLVDEFRFCTGRVYSEFYEASGNFNQYLGFESAEMIMGVPFHINNTENNGPEALIQDPDDPNPIASQINIRNRELVSLNLDHTVISQIANFDSDDARALMESMVPDKQRQFSDNSFKAPAAYFAQEADQRSEVFPHLVDIQVRIPNQLIYEDEVPTWLGGEYDYASRRPEMAIPPELTKQSIYRRFSYEYGHGEGTDSVPFPCAEDEMVQKFPAEETVKMLNINESAMDPAANTDFASFFNIAQPLAQIHTRIAFPTPDQDKGEITKLLRDHDLDSLMIGILDPESISTEKVYAQILETKVDFPIYPNINTGEKVSKYYKPRAQEDILNLIEAYLTSTEGTLNSRSLAEAMDPDDYPLGFSTDPGTATFLNPDSRGVWKANMVSNLADFGEQLLTFIADKTRTFDRILKGNLSYSEVMAYRIEKINKATNEVIQQFYFFNDPGMSQFEFLDTQILYGQEYTYNIYTINFVVGSKYKYTRDLGYKLGTVRNPVGSIDDEGNNVVHGPSFSLKIPVVTNTYFSIIEAPYFSQDVLVADLPPLSPEVKFYRGDVGIDLVQSLIVFDQNHGRYTETPISIIEGDRQIIERMTRVQNIEEGETDIQYGSDSNPTHYQMLVLSEPPQDYEDFSQGRFEETTARYPYFSVYFRKNKTYYLTFRTRDYAGISNPSKVVKVMIDTDGYWELDIYNFPNIEEDSLEFDRYLEVDLADIQTYIDLSASSEYPNEDDPEGLTETSRGTDGVSLGSANQEDSVWNRDFVFRVTSTETGESMDIRTSYSHINLRNNPGLFAGYRDLTRSLWDDLIVTEFVNSCVNKKIEKENIMRQLSLFRQGVFGDNTNILLGNLYWLGVAMGEIPQDQGGSPPGAGPGGSGQGSRQMPFGAGPGGSGQGNRQMPFGAGPGGSGQGRIPSKIYSGVGGTGQGEKQQTPSGRAGKRKKPPFGPGHPGEY